MSLNKDRQPSRVLVVQTDHAGCLPHLIHNSEWIAEQEAINSVYERHEGGWRKRLNHYFFVFHDEMFEALAQSVSARTVRATMSECVAKAAQTIVQK